jgi:major membrane immunogen (membrane-anchored lipoprotein)
MKNTPIILALSLLLTACSRHDAEFTKQVPGNWKHEGTSTRDTGTYASTTTISPDGTFSYIRQWNERPLTYTMAGTWQIKDGFMLMTVTNRSDQNMGAKVGEIIKSRIIRLDDRQFVYEVKGITNILSR